MTKAFNPVPDAECLKYHGKPGKPDIKIFVSHRIDLDAVTVDNPLYIPVRCGAVYDKREDVEMLGDNTGDNISEKRLSFCEYTVMYWAWKNIEADYYGLSHYRRYLSFLDEDFPGPILKQGFLDSMSHTTLERCGLLDREKMEREIAGHDAIVPYYYNFWLEESRDKSCKTIRENWLKYHPCYLKDADFDLMLRLIREHAPDIYPTAVEFVNGKMFCGFNCSVIKRDLFHELCEFMFPIMFAFEKELDTRHYSSTQKRAVGYIGEWLFSIFFVYQKTRKNRDIRERQILSFQDTTRSHPLSPVDKENSIPIVLVETDFNRPLLAVQIQSVLDHAGSGSFYDFIILHRGYNDDKWGTYSLKEEDKSLAEMLKDFPNASLRFYNPKEELLDIDVRMFNEPNLEEAYYLLLLPWILKHYKKAIYLKPGMLLQTDIAELMNTDLEDNYTAAVRDMMFAAELNGFNKEQKKLAPSPANPYDYVATDIVLLDLDKIRSAMGQRYVMKRLESLTDANITADGFNAIYQNKIHFLPQNWKKINAWGPDYYFILEYFPEDEFDEMVSAPACAISIFGAGGQLYPQQSTVMREFWRLAKKTPFYEELLLSMTAPDFQAFASFLFSRAGARVFGDLLLPKGTRRREIVKKILPGRLRR